VAGEGAALSEAKKLALDNKKVKFLGYLTQSELEHKIWSVTDLLINPSRVPESFGMGVIEAQAHGIPALVARIGALAQLVKDGETGWFFKPKDQFDIKRQIEFILANRDKLQPMKAKCLPAVEQFTIDKYLEKLLSHEADGQ
jgi:glycosyltransferase involved in cell wall biosynthesis